MKLALLTGLLAVALLVGAAVAQGSPAHRDAVLGATDEWIGSVLRVPVPDRADLPGAYAELGADEAGVPCATPGEVHYDPPLLEEMDGRSNLFFEDAWGIALHEHLHMRGGPCVYSATSPRTDGLEPGWVFWEEGFVDAVRIDLYPAFMRRMFGQRPRMAALPMGNYVANVAAVRAASRFATGSMTWRDRAARLWRRAGLVAGWDERQAMVAAATAARG